MRFLLQKFLSWIGEKQRCDDYLRFEGITVRFDVEAFLASDEGKRFLDEFDRASDQTPGNQ